MLHIEFKNVDYVYGMCRYRVVIIKTLFDRNMICKTWVIYKMVNKINQQKILHLYNPFMIIINSR